MSKSTPAWLLPISDSLQFSVNEQEAEAYIKGTIMHTVPQTPVYCRHVIFWQNMILPVVDLKKMVDNVNENTVTEAYSKHVFVVSYQTQDNAPLKYIAFKLSKVPEKITVKDDDACALPDLYPDTLLPYTQSLFHYKEQLTSIFNIAQLSSNA